MAIVHSLKNKMIETTNFLLCFFFPIYCVGCGLEGKYICSDCEQHLSAPGGEKLPDWILAGFDYRDDKIRQLIWRLKYQRETAVASEMINLLQEKIAQWNSLNDYGSKRKIIVIPTPLSWQRKFQRGYNQAEILARQLIATNPEKFELQTKWLKKIHHTKPQSHIKKREDRLANLAGAFRVDANPKSSGHNLKDLTILLIDDVTTTGATLLEIKKTFQKAGAKNVLAIVFAHG